MAADGVEVSARKKSTVRPTRALLIRSRHQVESVPVGQSVDAKVTIEREYLTQAVLLGERYQGRVRGVHGSEPF